ncbi:MAG TPA: hypothetical protein PLM79_17860 [Syntrophobacteraceae bacterium]|nr:hypothetical protein [Syntrophobacteraceae bacterium]
MRFITVGIVVLALFLGLQLPDMPERPAQAHKLTVKEMCRGPNHPDWCTELYADLAHGREVREKLRKEGKKVEESQPLDEIEQSHMEGL